MNFRIPNTESFVVDLDSSASICYSPLKQEIVLIDRLAASKLQKNTDEFDPELSDFIKNLKTPSLNHNNGDFRHIEKETRLSLIPNNICNLNCSYCYSASGRNNSKLSIENLETTLNWFIDPERIDGNFISIFITGGGEPLATWDITSRAVSSANKLAKERGLGLHISLITNGTLIDDNKIEFFKAHKCSIGISFDVLEDVQNTNRGMFMVVKRNIKRLLDAGLRVMINSTVIPSSVDKMVDAVHEVIKEYPGVVYFTMEPATGIALFENPNKMRNFYEQFILYYFQAKAIAIQHGLKLRFTFDDALRGIVSRHCPGKFALTPSGNISICHLVSSHLENRFKDCSYGVVSDNKVLIDHDKFNNLYGHNLFAYPECVDCIAKWSCGGECYTRRSTYPQEFMAEVCRFNRNVIELLLKMEVKDVEFS